MKKLMIAFTVCALVGLARAQSDDGAVYSANTVGYQKSLIPQGKYLAAGNPFIRVGTQATIGAGATLGDVIVNENFAPFEDSVQIFDEDGASVLSATYVSAAMLAGAGITGVEPGWWGTSDIEFENGALNNFSLPFGWSITAFSGYSGAELIFAGEVYKNAFTHTLTANKYASIANNSPVDLSLGDIVANVNFAPFEDSIQIFDENGASILSATYVSAAMLAGAGITGVEPGWWGMNDIEFENGALNGFLIPAGQAFIAFTGYSDVAITVPSPL